MREDDPFAPAPKRETPIEMMSIDELEVRISALRAEIEACERFIASKRAQRAAADNLFARSPQT